MEQLEVNRYQVGRINFLHNLRTSHNLLMKFSCVILFMSCMINVHSADPHYEKITNLYSEIKPRVPTRDKLRNMVEILKTTSSIPEDANYTIEEINKVLDIVLDIVIKNQHIFRYEMISLRMLTLIKTLNDTGKITLKKDSLCIDKVKNIIIENKNIGRYYHKRFIPEKATFELLFEMGYIDQSLAVIDNVFDKLRFNEYGHKEYLKLYQTIIEKLLKNKKYDNEKLGKFLYFLAAKLAPNANKKKRTEDALKILEFLENNYISNHVVKYAIFKQVYIYTSMKKPEIAKIHITKLKMKYPKQMKLFNSRIRKTYPSFFEEK